MRKNRLMTIDLCAEVKRSRVRIWGEETWNMMDPKLAEQIARIYWEKLEVTQRTMKSLASELRSRKMQDATRKAHWVMEWEKRGCVVHQVLSGDFCQDPPPRIIALEREILRHYVVRHVIVVKTAHLQGSLFRASAGSANDDLQEQPAGSGSITTLNGSLREDFTIHQCLAAWGASMFLAYHRKGDSIGVGPGRGPAYTVECICKRARKAALPSAKAIISLSGAMSRATEAEHFDADQVAGKLRDPVTADLCPVNSPLIPIGRASSTHERFLSKRKWRECCPAVALVGIGALAGQHRMLLNDHISDFDAARKDVESICALASQIDGAYKTWADKSKSLEPPYHCVGDMCNRLFIVPPPEVASLKKSLRTVQAGLEAAVDRFNRKIDRAMTAISVAQVQEIAAGGAVMAVAGGSFKRHAIRHVLSQDPPWITHLVTDEMTAQWLCDSKKPGPASEPHGAK
jgi:DNA-binding transcriptional regulator LsrR (DeoR family)